MQIFLDGHIFSQQKSGGISKYWAELIKEMAGKNVGSVELCLGQDARENIFVAELLAAIDSQVTLKPLPSAFQRAPRSKSILHSPYMLTPQRQGRSVRVLTVHDLIHKKVPSRGLRAWLRGKILDFSIAQADAYICVSANTRNELHALYPKTRKKPTQVIYHGIPIDFSSDIEVANKGGTETQPFVLFVGQRRGYKNFDLLTKALASSSLLEALELVCIGGSAFDKQERVQLTSLGLNGRTKHLAVASEDALKSFYDRALALAYPSAMEGFGMPILEAMARGCPVICSQNSAMGEIAAGFNYPFDPTQPESMTGTLEMLLKNGPDLQRIQQGREHARSFSWKKAAERTLEFYRELLAL